MTVSDWVEVSILATIEVVCVGSLIDDGRKAAAKRRRAREETAREIGRIEADANQSVDRLQDAFWRAQRMLRDERDHS